MFQGALAATDASLVRWIAADQDLNESLLRSSPKECANHLRGDLVKVDNLSIFDRNLLLKMQDDWRELTLRA